MRTVKTISVILVLSFLGMDYTGKLVSNLGSAAGTIDSSIRHTEQGLDILRKYLR